MFLMANNKSCGMLFDIRIIRMAKSLMASTNAVKFLDLGTLVISLRNSTDAVM